MPFNSHPHEFVGDVAIRESRIAPIATIAFFYGAVMTVDVICSAVASFSRKNSRTNFRSENQTSTQSSYRDDQLSMEHGSGYELRYQQKPTTMDGYFGIREIEAGFIASAFRLCVWFFVGAPQPVPEIYNSLNNREASLSHDLLHPRFSFMII